MSKCRGRVVGGMGITGVLEIKIYEDDSCWVWMVGEGSFYTTYQRANEIYNRAVRRVA